LLRYNSAPAYALAVAHLSERFIGAAPFVIAWPMADRPLLPKEIAAMQRWLLASGFDTGDVDGVLGAMSTAFWVAKPAPPCAPIKRRAGLPSMAMPRPAY